MPRHRRPSPLYRSDVRQYTDRPTNSIVLQYVGKKRLDWEGRIYGYDDGTFFVVDIDDVGYPPSVTVVAEDLGVDLDQMPSARQLREATAHALVSEAMVEAPGLLADLAEPRLTWQAWDERELERKHAIACARLRELSRIMVTEMRVRCAPMCAPAAPESPVLGPPPAHVSDLPMVVAESDPEPLPEPLESLPEPAPVAEAVEDVEVEEDPSASLVAGSMVVQRAQRAVAAARNNELPQRLPGGARRRLKRMPPGAYIAYGEALDIRAELCGAMTDARAYGRKGRETVVIDWDGEWPVVVRRYGAEGRTIYKVEDALRRHGIHVKLEEVA